MNVSHTKNNNVEQGAAEVCDADYIRNQPILFLFIFGF